MFHRGDRLLPREVARHRVWYPHQRARIVIAPNDWVDALSLSPTRHIFLHHVVDERLLCSCLVLPDARTGRVEMVVVSECWIGALHQVVPTLLNVL